MATLPMDIEQIAAVEQTIAPPVDPQPHPPVKEEKAWKTDLKVEGKAEEADPLEVVKYVPELPTSAKPAELCPRALEMEFAQVSEPGKTPLQELLPGREDAAAWIDPFIYCWFHIYYTIVMHPYVK